MQCNVNANVIMRRENSFNFKVTIKTNTNKEINKGLRHICGGGKTTMQLNVGIGTQKEFRFSVFLRN